MIAKIGALLAQVLGSQVARDVAMKYFLKALIIAVVPLVCLVTMNMIMDMVVEYVIEQVAAVNAEVPVGVAWAPLAMYLWVAVGLDVAIGVIIGAMSTKLVLRSIPFIRV